MNDTQDLLTRIYHAFNTRDIDAVLATMSPDVDWPNGMEGGRMQGRDAVREYWLRQWSMIDPTVIPQRFDTADDGTVIAHVHQVVRDLEGTILVEQMVEHIYSIDNGMIERMEIKADSPILSK